MRAHAGAGQGGEFVDEHGRSGGEFQLRETGDAFCNDGSRDGVCTEVREHRLTFGG